MNTPIPRRSHSLLGQALLAQVHLAVIQFRVRVMAVVLPAEFKLHKRILDMQKLIKEKAHLPENFQDLVDQDHYGGDGEDQFLHVMTL